jgi:hypothetical protein
LTEEKSYSLDESQRELAKITNHRVWDLLEKPDRSPGESEEMLQAAYASLYHWSKVGNGVHLQRGYWLLAKVSISLGKKSDAFGQAEKCRELTEKYPDEMKDFDQKQWNLVRRSKTNRIRRSSWQILIVEIGLE